MIIFINGSVNSGKSTVSKLLAEKLHDAALVEIDALRAMIAWMPLEQAIPINLENAVSVIRNFAKNNLHVVVPYPMSEKNYEYMTNAFKDLDTKIYVFTLAPQLEKVLMNRGGRELTDWERDRIKYHYDIGIQKPSFGEIIDNSDITPDQTVNIILGKLNQ